MSSIWFDIPNYKGSYQINKDGDVKSLARVYIDKNGEKRKLKERILKHSFRVDGYPFIRLCVKCKVKSYSIHRLIAEVFIPNPRGLPCVNHINGVKTDCRIENLEWCTHRENLQHASKTGLIARGERAGRAQLKDKDALDIIEGASDGFTVKEISSHYKVSCAIIRNLLNGVTFSWLTGIKYKELKE